MGNMTDREAMAQAIYAAHSTAADPHPCSWDAASSEEQIHCLQLADAALECAASLGLRRQYPTT